jgi:hypothetical protein
MIRIAFISLIVVLFVAGCAQPVPTSAADPTVHVTLSNSGPTPLRCRIMFGHWVNRDLGILTPGNDTGFDVRQSPKDGALYIMRSDGQRRMMIQNLYCAVGGGPQSTEEQVDLAPARASRPSAIVARCAMQPGGSRVECPPASLKP